MKYLAFCPVSDKRINEKVARTNAAFTVGLIGLFAVTQNIIPIVFLAIDFLFRAADYSRFSLIALTSRGIVKFLKPEEYLINAGPKIFAARIGFVLSLLVTLFFLFGAPVPAVIIAVILGIFSFLESVFGLCVACEIYPYLYRFLNG